MEAILGTLGAKLESLSHLIAPQLKMKQNNNKNKMPNKRQVWRLLVSPVNDSVSLRQLQSKKFEHGVRYQLR